MTHEFDFVGLGVVWLGHEDGLVPGDTGDAHEGLLHQHRLVVLVAHGELQAHSDRQTYCITHCHRRSKSTSFTGDTLLHFI